MKFDPNSTPNQGRWRLKDPDLFRNMWTKHDKEEGISYIVGFLKNNAYAVQAIRFDKSVWTEKKADKWWNENKKRFTKTWSDDDWKKKRKISRRKALAVSKKLIEMLGLTYLNPSAVTIDYKFKENIGIPVGSLRQGKKEVGDLDIIITRQISKEKIKETLHLQSITGGEKRIDFRFEDINVNLFVFVYPHTWGAALLHSTGPYIYNVRLRNRLKSKKWIDVFGEGWKLSQNGLEDGKGEIFSTPTERSLQILMDVSERKPDQR